MRIVLLGLPGTGKGTQGSLLAEYYRVPHIATGDIVRDHISRGTEFGRKVQAAIADGNFAPDADIMYWVSRRLMEPDAVSGYILDGFPRDLAQATQFDAENDAKGRHLDAVIEMTIAEADLTERLSGRLVCSKCGESYHVVTRAPRVTGFCDHDGSELIRRQDDEPAAIKRRFEVYYSETEPLRDYYQARGVYLAVDGNDTAPKVFERIRRAIDGRNVQRLR